MIKGSLGKDIITKHILSIFPGSFIDGKDIRIPVREKVGYSEIKVTLTFAKENLHEGGPAITEDTPVMSANSAVTPNNESTVELSAAEKNDNELTIEEKSLLKTVIEALGL